jgi:DnaJ-class molecular chaperone
MSSNTNTQHLRYYNILKIAKNASASDIRSAYKALSRKYHPDRNLNDPEKAKRKFQEIAEAYEVLKDPEKRSIYDQFGEKGLKQSGFNFDVTNVDDLLKFAFADDDNDDSKGDSTETVLAKLQLPVSLEDLYRGSSKNVTYHYQYNCAECNGRGITVVEDYAHCVTCDGRGKFTKNQRSSESIPCDGCGGLGSSRTQRILCETCGGSKKYRSYGWNHDCTNCDDTGHQFKSTKCNRCKGQKFVFKTKQVPAKCRKCSGEGFIANTHKTPCSECQGRKQKHGTATQTVQIEPGSANNETIRVKHIDHNLGVYGVVLVQLVCAKHDVFVVRGDDLHMTKSINLRQALLGGDFTVPHLSGQQLYVESDGLRIIEFNGWRKIVGKGMPKKGIEHAFGDLFIRFRISMPQQSQLTHKQTNALLQLCSILSSSGNHGLSANGYNSERVALVELDEFEQLEFAHDSKVNQASDVTNSAEPNQEASPECKQM